MRKNISFLIITFFLISPCFVKAQTSEYFKIQKTAKVDAKLDAKPKKILWGIAGFGSTILCGPIICGGITVAAAYLTTNSNIPVPLFRFKKMNNELNKQEFLLYSRIYSSERVKIQRKENVKGALSGIGTVFLVGIGIFLFYIAAVIASN